LLADRPSDIFARWADDAGGFLQKVLPDLAALRGVSQLPAHRDDAFVHTLKVVDSIEPTPVRRWAALLHDIGKGPTFIEAADGRSRFFEHDKMGAEMAPEIMQAVGEAPELIEPVRRLVGLHMRPISYSPEWTDAAVRRLAEEAQEGRGPDGWPDLLALSRADLNGYVPEPIARGLWVLDQLEQRYESIRERDELARLGEVEMAKSPLDGNEIQALTGREPGPWLGELKDYLRMQVEGGNLSREDRDEAARLARAWLEQQDTHS
jgi:putative nucleotidyltransferase with HDIG domain